MVKKIRSSKTKWRPKLMRHLPPVQHKEKVLLPTRAKHIDGKLVRRIYFLKGSSDTYFIRYRPGKGVGFRKVRVGEMRQARERHFAMLKEKQKHHQHAKSQASHHKKKTHHKK